MTRSLHPGSSTAGAERTAGSTAGRRATVRRASARLGWWRIGLIGVASIAFGSGWYQVWFGPPYRYVDEQAHVGYVLELEAGRLPTIDTPIDADAGGPELTERLSLEQPRRRHVWVANNPPAAYAAAALAGSVTSVLDVSGGPLIGVRLVNLLAMTAAVVMACRLGRTLSGGGLRAGLLTGAVVAGVPHLGFLAGMGMTDGAALLAAVGTVDAATRVQGRGTVRWWARLLAWAAVGTMVRPMTAVLCASVVVIAGVREVACRRGSKERVGSTARGPGESTAERSTISSVLDRRSWGEGTSRLLVVAGVAAMVSAGWYVRNVVLYGDPTGSSHLFEKFDRTPRGLGELSWGDAKVVLDTLFLRRLQNELDSDPLGWSPVVLAILVLGIVGLLVGAAWERRHRTSDDPAPSSRSDGDAANTERVSRRVGGHAGPVRLDVLGTFAAVAIVNVGLVAQHWSGGGGLHPRYALLLVPILVAPIATVVGRWGGRIGALVVLAAPLLVLWHQVPISTRWVNDHKTAPLESPLTMSIGPEWLRLSGLLLVAVGGGLVAVALVAVRADAAWRTRRGER